MEKRFVSGAKNRSSPTCEVAIFFRLTMWSNLDMFLADFGICQAARLFEFHFDVFHLFIHLPRPVSLFSQAHCTAKMMFGRSAITCQAGNVPALGNSRSVRNRRFTLCLGPRKTQLLEELCLQNIQSDACSRKSIVRTSRLRALLSCKTFCTPAPFLA